MLSPRLPHHERRELATRCTAQCQRAEIRWRECCIIGEAVLGVLYGWGGLSEPLQDEIAAAMVCLALCIERRTSEAVMTVPALMAFIILVLRDAYTAWEHASLARMGISLDWRSLLRGAPRRGNTHDHPC
jgi:hypothetical protein